MCGESGAEQWKNDLEEIIQDRDPKNIVKIDETGLFYKCTPDETLAFKGECCIRWKMSKEQVTLLVRAT